MEPNTGTECGEFVINSRPVESTNECIDDISTDFIEKGISFTANTLDINSGEETISKISQVAEEGELLLVNENDTSDTESMNENTENNLQIVAMDIDSTVDFDGAQITVIIPEEEKGKEQLSLLSTDDTEEVVSIEDGCTDEIGIQKVASSQSTDGVEAENDDESSLPSNTGTDVSSLNENGDDEDLNLIENQNEPFLTKEKEEIKANFKIIIDSIPDQGCFCSEDYTDSEDRNECIDIFKLVDSIESRDTSEKDACDKDELSDDSSSNSRKVKFHKDVVTSVRRSPRWTPEEKSFLFYTGREMYSFRMEYILELNEGQGINHEEWQKFQGRGHLRLFWSLYAAMIDFFSCKVVAQYCCGENTAVETHPYYVYEW